MIFDAIVLAAVLISSVIAFLRGFIRECLTIIGVVGGLAASYFAGPLLAPLMRGWLGVSDDPEKVKKLFDIVPMTVVADVCAYGAIFVVVVIVLSVLSHFLSAGAKAVGLGPVDRAMGVVFGIARAMLLVSLLYLPFYLLNDKEERDKWTFMQDSKSRYYVEEGAAMIARLLPEDTEKKADDKVEEAGKKMDETRQRLEDLDVLRKTTDKAGDALEKAQGALSKPAGSDTASDAQGYQPEQREKLDEIFETNQ